MKSYLLGADGGGTKTAIVLTDLDLNPILKMQFPRSNPGDIGFDAAVGLLTESFLTVCREASVQPEEIVSVFAGIAGGSAGNFSEVLIQALSGIFPNAVCGASHDGINVLYSAYPDGNGVCVICGTGSSCFVKNGADVFRIGGCGQFDLKGNGFEIGRAAFAHVFRAMDGRDPSGWLSAEINRRFGGNAHDRIIEINQYSKNEFAKFAPLVFEAAVNHQDPCAMHILEDQIAYVAEMINSAGRFFPSGTYSVALAGGIASNPLTMQLLRNSIPESVTLFLIRQDPYMGAVAKAKAMLSGDPCLVETKFHAI